MARKRTEPVVELQQGQPCERDTAGPVAAGRGCVVASRSPPQTHEALAAAQRRPVWVMAGIVCSAVFAVYGQTLRHDFVNYDDEEYVYENPHVVSGVTAEGIVWAATQRYEANWHPLTWISHMIDWHAYGGWAGGHHLTSLLLHAATSVALLLLLVRMTARPWASGFAAALFAVHPMRVESVAWVAERKDVLSGLLFVLVLWAYVSFLMQPFSWRRYAAVVGLFALGLTAKPMLVTTPFVLLLLDYWPLGRWHGASPETAPAEKKPAKADCAPQLRAASIIRLIAEKLPLAALSLISCAITLWAQSSVIVGKNFLPVRQRLANLVTAYASYVLKFFFPARLAVFYPYSRNGIPAWKVGTGLLLLITLSAWAVLRRRKRPYLLVGWLWFLGMLVPVIGLVQVGSQSMANRYTYLPQIGLAIACAYMLESCSHARGYATIAKAVAALMVAGLMAAACYETSFWRNSEVLWRRALDCAPPNDRAYFSLGHALYLKQRPEEALECYQKALSLNPGLIEAQQNAAKALNDLGRLNDALPYLQASVELAPRRGDTNLHLAYVEARLGRLGEAVRHYRQAVAAYRASNTVTREDLTDAQNGLGTALLAANSPGEAAAEFREVLSRDEKNPTAECNLANALLQQGRDEEAANHYSHALQLKADIPVAAHNLAWFLQRHGRAQEAIALYQEAVRSQPDYFDAYCHLGAALETQGRIDEAIAAFQKAAAIRPDSSDANLASARLLAAQGRDAEASPYLERGRKAARNR